MSASDPLFTRYRATGEDSAFRALVEAHVAMVHAVALRRLGPHAHLAADVAQAVFSRLARAAGVLPADLLVASWLHRQAVRLAIDTVRKEERRLIRETTAAMLQTPEGAGSPDAAALLDEALDRLPAGDRSVLVLRYLEDRDFAAVAAAVGSTPEAARKRIARSLEKLRALLSRRGVALTAAALALFLTEQSSRAVPASLLPRVTAAAFRAAVPGRAGFLFTTALMSHATALSTGTLAALLACGLFYHHQETEISRRATVPLPAFPASFAHAGFRRGELSEEESGPATLPEIIAALEVLTAAPNHSLTQERAAVLLRRVAPGEYREFFAAAEERIHPVRWQSLVVQATRLWKEVDPGALTRALFDSDNRKRALIRETALHRNMAFNFFRISTGSDGGGSVSMLYKECFLPWLDRDLPAARRWLEEMAREPLMTMPWQHGETLGGKLADLLAERLPAGGSLANLPAEGLNASQTRVLREQWADGVIRQAGDFTSVLTASARGTEEARLLAFYCARRDPAACQEVISGMPEGEARFAAALGFLSQETIEGKNSMTSLDARARLPRADFALTQAGGRAVSEVLPEIVRALLGSQADSAAAIRSWVLEKGGGSSGEALATGARWFAEQTWSMRTAVEWAATMPDPGSRDPLLRGICQRWSDAAPEAAAAYLKATPGLAALLLPPAGDP